MDQVERALLVVSGDAASGKLVADSHVGRAPVSSSVSVSVCLQSLPFSG